MRNLILQEFVTLDALAAGPHGSVDFIPASTQSDQAFGREQLALMDRIDTILLGSVTYRMFAGYWPNVTEGDDKPFADKLNAMEKVVFSSRLDRAPWGSWGAATVVRGRASDHVAALKAQPGKDLIVWGSLSVAQSLIKDGLVDEYRLVVCPLVMGHGRPLFDQSAPLDLRLVDATKADRGAVSLKYTRRNVQ